MKTNLIVFIISFLTFIDAVRQKLSLTDPKTLQETEFALTSLKKLSDSRIYQSLSLSRILRAEEVEVHCAAFFCTEACIVFSMYID